MGTAVTFAVVVFALLAFIWAFQRSMMYFPFAHVPPLAEVGLSDAEDVTFSAADGVTLHAWFVQSGQSPARATILVFNGNAGNRAYRVPLAQALRSLGFHVLLFDYRGFGGSGGTPTEDGLKADARAALDYVRRRDDVDATRVIYFGESLGTGVAVALAAEQPPARLILRSPFTSMTDVGRLHYPILPVRWLLRDRYASIDAIARVSCPVLVIAGDRDGIIPVEQSRRLYEAVPGSAKTLLIVRGADHNDEALLSGREMIAAIDQFVR
jgi:uncharacterized protein